MAPIWLAVFVEFVLYQPKFSLTFLFVANEGVAMDLLLTPPVVTGSRHTLVVIFVAEYRVVNRFDHLANLVEVGFILLTKILIRVPFMNMWDHVPPLLCNQVLAHLCMILVLKVLVGVHGDGCLSLH